MGEMGARVQAATTRLIRVQLRLRLRALAGILSILYPLWLGLLVSLLLAFVGFQIAPSLEQAFRWAGAAGQLIGLLCVAFGLEHLQKAVGRPTVTGQLITYAKRILGPLKGKTVSVGLAESVETAASVEGGSLWSKMGSERDLDDRLQAIERNIFELRRQADQQRQEHREALAKVHDTIARERQTREEREKATRGLVEDVSVGGLRVEGFGLVMLTTGMLMASLPAKFAAVAAPVFDSIWNVLRHTVPL